MPSGSNAATPTMTLYTSKSAVTLTSSSLAMYTSGIDTLGTDDTSNTVLRATAFYAKLNPHCSPYTGINDKLWRCDLLGQPTITATTSQFPYPNHDDLHHDSNTFVFCLPDPANPVPYVYPQSSRTVIVQAAPASTRAVSTVVTVNTGYLALTQYGDSACRTAPQVATYYALGRCAQTGLQTSLIRSAKVNGTLTSFVGTAYASLTCDPSTAGRTGLASMGLDTTTACQANAQGGMFLTATYATALPPLPAGQLAQYWYTDAATCAAGTAVPLQARYWAPQTCSPYFGMAYHQEMCAANVTLTSTTGGFVIQRYYNTAGCQGVPTVTNFNQLNVCGQNADSGSFMYVSKKKASGASSVTVFQMMQFASNDCSGNPLLPSLLSSLPSMYGVTNMASPGNATYAAEGDTSMICAPSGLGNPGMAYVTVLYAPVLAFASGWGVGNFNSRKACNGMDTTRFFSGTQYTGGCVQDAMTASNYYTVAGCPTDSSAGTPTTVMYTFSFQGVSLATAQSASFQTKCVQVVSAYAGVAASSVSIVSVMASGGSRRRALLQSGVNVNVAIRAAQSTAPSLKNILGHAGPAIGNALAVPYPGFAVGLLAIAPSPASPSTAWATPGAIAGVVVGGAAAITLIVLLSVFIPRMRHRQQAQEFSPGYAQQQGSAPGAFVPSPQQHEESGLEVGGKVVTF